MALTSHSKPPNMALIAKRRTARSIGITQACQVRAAQLGLLSQRPGTSPALPRHGAKQRISDGSPPRSTDPPPEVLNHAIDVYRTMIHLQPLPLFRLRDLSHHLASSPRFLLHSFLALTLSFRSHTAYHDRQAEVAESYARSGQDTVRKLAFQGVSTLEVIQSLCLLALRDILGNYQTPGPPSAPKPLKS